MRTKKIFAIIFLICCSIFLVFLNTDNSNITYTESSQVRATENLSITNTKWKPTLRIYESPTPNPRKSATPDDICIPQQQPIRAEVIQVINGESIEVLIDGEKHIVRYIGMNTAEIENVSEKILYYGLTAKQKNVELVAGKEVLLYRDQREVDRFGRLLRYVFVDDIFVNLEMIRNGLAINVDSPPNNSCFEEFHNAKHDAGMGMKGFWGAESVYGPWTVESDSIEIVSINYLGIENDESDEYVEIANISDNPVNLKDWTLTSSWSIIYKFPDIMILPGQTCKIYTNQNHPESCGLNWNYQRAVWNNKSDCAILDNESNKCISSYCY